MLNQNINNINSLFCPKHEKSKSLFQLSQLASEAKEKQSKNNSLAYLIKSTKNELIKNNQRLQNMSLDNIFIKKIKRIKHMLKKDNEKLSNLNKILNDQIFNQQLKYNDTLQKYHEILGNVNEELECVKTTNFIYKNKIQEKKSNILTLEKRLKQVKINSIFVSIDNYEIDVNREDEPQIKEILTYYSYYLYIQLKEFNKYVNECQSLIQNKLILNKINFCNKNQISYHDELAKIPKNQTESESDSDSYFDDSEISELNFSNGNSFEASSKSYGSDTVIKSSIIPKLDFKLIEYNKSKKKTKNLNSSSSSEDDNEKNAEKDKIKEMEKQIKLLKIKNKNARNKIKEYGKKINKIAILINYNNTIVTKELK